MMSITTAFFLLKILSIEWIRIGILYNRFHGKSKDLKMKDNNNSDNKYPLYFL